MYNDNVYLSLYKRMCDIMTIFICHYIRYVNKHKYFQYTFYVYCIYMSMMGINLRLYILISHLKSVEWLHLKKVTLF